MKEIKLTRGYVALVDDEDFEYLSQWKWKVSIFARRMYAIRNGPRDKTNNNKRKVYLLHREIMKTPIDLVVDHIDHDGLNNQKSNLRNCTRKENQRNRRSALNKSSKYLGVCLLPQRAKQVRRPSIAAFLKLNGKMKYLGYHKTEEAAARAYDAAAKKYYGEFANLNFPEDNSKQ